MRKQLNVAETLQEMPEGVYQAIINSSDFKDTKKGGKMLVLDFTVTQGAQQGSTISAMLNIENENAQTEKYADQEYARICSALGFTETPADTVAMHNIPLMIEVKIKKDNDWTKDDGTVMQGREKPVLSPFGYKKVPSVGTQQAAQMTPAAGTQPVAQPQPTQAAPATAQAPASAPWNN